MQLPCYRLLENVDAPIMGYWKGDRSDFDLSDSEDGFHLLSLHEEYLNDLDLFQWKRETPYSVRGIRRSPEWYGIVPDTTETPGFDDLEFTGTPLNGLKAISYPPFSAICLYGSGKVAQALNDQGLTRGQYQRIISTQYNLFQEYVQWSDENFCDLSDSAVRIGGWTPYYPTQDFYTPPEYRFIACSSIDAEPWYEITHNWATNLTRVESHIT